MKRNDERPWGTYEVVYHDEKTTVKILTIRPTQRLSLQSHALRDEQWCILEGTAFFVVENQRMEVMPEHDGNVFYEVERGEKHRIEAGPEGCVVLEVARGEFDDDDIVRFEDDYNRI